MPGPFTHIYTARRVADFLKSEQVTEDFIRNEDGNLVDEQKLIPELLKLVGRKECAAAMENWPKFTAVGAIGPEFIWLEFKKKWDQFIDPILDKAGQVVDDLTGGMLTALGDAFTELKNAIISLTEEEILVQGDIFGWFSLKMRMGYDEKAFVWSDMTHYRRTSVVPARFIAHAREMLQNDATAEHGEQLLAFALGWICHVGTDVIEHSFVNEQCGGPFRTHWQRHHLIENHIDAWNYECTGNGKLPADPFVGWQDTYRSVADSALYFAVQIPRDIDTLDKADKQGDLRKPLPDDTGTASQAIRKDLLDTDGALPTWLSDTIIQTFIEVFADPDTEGGSHAVQDPLLEPLTPHPQNLEGQQFQDDLNTTTDLIAKWLGILGISNVGIKLEDLRNIVAPNPPDSIFKDGKPGKIPVGFPFPWEIQAAYRFMLSWFKRSYMSTMDIDRPPPPTIFTPPASDFNFDGPPDAGGFDPADPASSNVCSELAALLDWVFKTLEKAAQLLYDLAKTVLSAATLPARELLYELITLPLWEATENMRQVLVHLGFIMPQSQELYADGALKRANEIDQVLIKLGHTVDSAFQEALSSLFDPLGNLPLDTDPLLTKDGVRNVLADPNPWLPVRKAEINKNPDVVEYLRPWGFPSKNNEENNPLIAGNYLELPLTVPGPYPTNTMPDQLLATNGIISNPARTLYQDSGCPDDTNTYNNAFILKQGTINDISFRGTNPLGDPVNFSAYLIGQIANNPKFLSSFNLDADRGYGYLCWDWKRDNPPKNSTQHFDKRGHPFKTPNQWPEGADYPLWTPPPLAPVQPAGVTPNELSPAMELWYPGRACKENQGGEDGPPEVPK
ncbi:hypothetical protein F5882DRAFT_501242 [Hyaloscypha sp. PMI_1271]|nr:hypothetical protein F5882DRAFT_501242 [Hyaloscypha sp. PMI_1271]